MCIITCIYSVPIGDSIYNCQGILHFVDIKEHVFCKKKSCRVTEYDIGIMYYYLLIPT